MNGVYLFGIAIALVSIWGAAYLLRVWHEDRDEMRARGEHVTWLWTWPLSRVLAYIAIACTLASNTVGLPLVLRLTNVPNYREIGIALTPFTVVALLILDVAFVAIAIYLRIIRSRA